MGTPRYMAPELRQGARNARAASDVYAFGVIAHQLLTRELPRGTVPPGPPVDGALGELLLRCLAIDAERRPTAADLAAAFAGDQPPVRAAGLRA